MAMAISGTLKTLGFNVQGDVGGLTMYTSRRRGLVIFDKAPPLAPASYAQMVQRNRYRSSAYAWRALTKEQKAMWQQATEKPKLMLTGYNLFTWFNLTKDEATLDTIIRNSGVDLRQAGI